MLSLPSPVARRSALVTLLALIVSLAIVCSGGDGDDRLTPTATPERTPATEAPGPGIPMLEGVFETGFQRLDFAEQHGRVQHEDVIHTVR